MTKQQASAILSKADKQLTKLIPEIACNIRFDVIDDPNGTHDSRSYTYPLKTYKRTWIYINLRSISSLDDLLQSIAHELSHAICIHFEHYNDVITKLIPECSADSMCTLFNQTSESFVDVASPFILFWLKSFLSETKKDADLGAEPNVIS